MAIPGLEVTERPWAGNSDARVFARDPGPGNPNVPPGGSAEARSLRAPPAVVTPPPTTAPGRLRAAFDSVTGRNFVGPNQPMSTAARVGAGLGVAAGVASEAPDVLAVARDPNSSGVDVATQVAGASGKLAAAGLGAKAGAVLGAFGGPVAPVTIPLGAALGGAAGYFGADKLIEGGRSLSGSDTRDPAEQVKASATGVPGAAQVAPAVSPAAPNPTDQRLAVGSQAPAAPSVPPSLRNDITRVGNEYSGTSVTGPITINGQQPGGGTISPQNMTAGNNLAATDSLRSQGAVMSGQSGGSGIPTMAAPGNSDNSWQARKNLDNLRTAAGSITNQRRWGGEGSRSADAQTLMAAEQADVALRGGMDPGSVSRNSAQASMFGSKTAADASKETSRNSLRGTMYTADTQLGAKRMEMQQKLRQQQALGGIYQAAGGDPVKAAKLAASYGIDGKQFTDMAQAEQSRTQGNVKDARSTFDNMFTRDGKNGPERDENAEAMAHQLASQIVPGWETMSAEQRAQNRTKVVDATRVVQNMNSLRNTGWLQKAGIDAPTPAYSQLPDMGGARVSDVGMWEGLTTPEVRSGDKKISLRNGDTRYLPQGSLTESQLRLLQTNGAQRQ